MPRPRRPKLGQHFLADLRYRLRIADSLPLRADDLVVEIGAGRGAMTPLLAERARRVLAIELDRELAAQLQEEFSADSRIEVAEADILSVDFVALCRGHEADRCYVFGNLPYYITSPIIDRLRSFRRAIRGMALLVQKEVADRLVAGPGRRDYGYLSVAVQLFTKPRISFIVPPGAFSPPPRVQSALVEFQIEPRLPDYSAEDEERLLNFVKSCFAQKRKNLINNLSALAGRERLEMELERLGLPASVRAEEMTIEQFAQLLGRL